ncbi:MAG: hypothetical protein V1872_07830 [bacterium]
MFQDLEKHPEDTKKETRIFYVCNWRKVIFTLMTFGLLALIISVFSPDIIYAGEIIITDITPTAFSIVCTEQETNYPDLIIYNAKNEELYNNNNSKTSAPLNSYTDSGYKIKVTYESNKKTSYNGNIGELEFLTEAEDRGIYKITISNLIPDTGYLYKIGEEEQTEIKTCKSITGLEDVLASRKEVLLYPVSEQLSENDHETSPAHGALVMLTLLNASDKVISYSPLTSFVGQALEGYSEEEIEKQPLEKQYERYAYFYLGNFHDLDRKRINNLEGCKLRVKVLGLSLPEVEELNLDNLSKQEKVEGNTSIILIN